MVFGEFVEREKQSGSGSATFRREKQAKEGLTSRVQEARACDYGSIDRRDPSLWDRPQHWSRLDAPSQVRHI